MARLSLVIVVTLAAALGAAAAPAHAQQAPQLNITDVDASQYPRITAVVTALDSSGFPVGNLGPADFTATEQSGEDESVQLTVDEVSVERLALGVVIVIDVSGSMIQPDATPLNAAKQAARDFIQTLGGEDTAALYAFSTDVREVVPFTSDKQRLIAGVDGLQAAGDTSLFAAAQQTSQVAVSALAPRKAVVFLTDGQDTTSPVSREDALAAVDRADVPVYGVGFGASPDASFLQQLAQATNGLYRAAEPGTVRAVYGEISRLLDSQYTLEFTAPEGTGEGGASVLRVVSNIDGTEAQDSFDFQRPVVAVPTTAPPPGEPAAATTDDDEDAGPAPALIAGSVLGAAMFAVLAFVAYTMLQRGRTRRRQEAVVAPNIESARTKPLPQRVSTIINGDDGAGRLVVLDGDGAGATYDFASTPLRIGTAPYCEVRLEASADVAPQHAMVWMKDRKIMLRHVAGPRRTTMVNGRPVDWVILDEGDVLVIGGRHYRAEPREE